MSRTLKALLVAAGLVLVAAVFGTKIYLELKRGEQVFWLAELWPPAAVLSIGLVTCIEFLLPPKAPAVALTAPVAPISRRRGRPKGGPARPAKRRSKA
jgi:hypothetical protein